MKEATLTLAADSAAGPVAMRFETPPADSADLRRELLFAAWKWDAQVGDVDAVCTAPLVLSRKTWSHLASQAQRLDAEIIGAEDAMEGANRTAGLPRRLRKYSRATPGVRVMRFDFHATDSGWRVSEVNSDVPGGYVEAGPMARLVATRYPGLMPIGDPAAALAAAFARRLRPGSLIALVHATAFSDDRQAMEVAGAALVARDLAVRMTSPDHLTWSRDGVPSLGSSQRIDGILRFFPGEWLADLPRACRRGWLACAVPAANPLRALLSQDKRAALAWDPIAMPTWHNLVLVSRCPSGLGEDVGDYVIKPTWGREGSGISMPEDAPPLRQQALRTAARRPARWVAQRRFVSRPIPSPIGMAHCVIGVFTVDGIASGAFARAVTRPPIDHRAVHAAVLVEQQP